MKTMQAHPTTLGTVDSARRSVHLSPTHWREEERWLLEVTPVPPVGAPVTVMLCVLCMLTILGLGVLVMAAWWWGGGGAW